MLGTLLRDACVPGTLAGWRQNKCKIESRVSLVSERERSNFKVTVRSLSLSLCFGCFRFEREGLSPVSPSFPGRRSRSSSSASRLPLPPRPSHCPPLPSPIASLTDHHVADLHSWLLALLAGTNQSSIFGRGFWGRGQARVGEEFFFLEEGKARAPGSAER